MRTKNLSSVLSLEHPLGLHYTEVHLEESANLFGQLYIDADEIESLQRNDSQYIVGRKGAGKTAFLIGDAYKRDVIHLLIDSADIYYEIENLRSQYREHRGSPLVVDQLVHAWEVVLYHAAFFAISMDSRVPPSDAKRLLYGYVTSFGNSKRASGGLPPVTSYFASVGAALRSVVLEATDGMSFQDACWNLAVERCDFHEAVAALREMVSHEDREVAVFVDNLEDLHDVLDHYSDVIKGLFRVVSRQAVVTDSEQMPFTTRFAFPAELLTKLRELSSNSDKDILDPGIIRWTASELISLVGNRVRWFLDANFPAATRAAGLPEQHSPRNSTHAAAALRSILCDGDVVNGLGSSEDPVAYIMRHTQLVPRQLILILNQILGDAVRLHPDSPRATQSDIIDGVRKAENTIVQSILTSHQYDYPNLGDAIDRLKNTLPPLFMVGDLRRAFTRNDCREFMEFRPFLLGVVAVGALGIVDPETSESRYTNAQFAYTFADSIAPLEGRDGDTLCVHPLFLYKFFDRRLINRMRLDGTKPVYPYGSDPDHRDFDV